MTCVFSFPSIENRITVILFSFDTIYDYCSVLLFFIRGYVVKLCRKRLRGKSKLIRLKTFNSNRTIRIFLYYPLFSYFEQIFRQFKDLLQECLIFFSSRTKASKHKNKTCDEYLHKEKSREKNFKRIKTKLKIQTIQMPTPASLIINIPINNFKKNQI